MTLFNSECTPSYDEVCMWNFVIKTGYLRCWIVKAGKQVRAQKENLL